MTTQLPPGDFSAPCSTRRTKHPRIAKPSNSPAENALSLTADGAVLSVARMDGGDGKAWGDHRFKPYYASRSAQASRGKV